MTKDINDEHTCLDCGCELTKADIEAGARFCYGCYTWYSDYAELDGLVE